MTTTDVKNREISIITFVRTIEFRSLEPFQMLFLHRGVAFLILALIGPHVNENKNFVKTWKTQGFFLSKFQNTSDIMAQPTTKIWK